MVEIVLSVLLRGQGHDVRMLNVSNRSKVEKDDRKTVCVSTDLITLCWGL